MTTATPSDPGLFPKPASQPGTPGSWRPRAFFFLMMLLNVCVWSLVVFSMAPPPTYYLWLDLRTFSAGTQVALYLVFELSVNLVIALSAGPIIQALFKKKMPPLPKAWVRSYTLAIHWLLMPTYFIIACLIANMGYYYRLYQLGLIDSTPPIPISFWIGVLLTCWVLCIRRWLRLGLHLPSATPQKLPSRWKRLAFVLLSLVIMLFVFSFLFIHTFTKPLKKPVDLAVVLGNRVLPDGTASVTLADRTRAAIDLYNRGMVKQLFLSGAVWAPLKKGEHELNEPAAMEKVCLDAGVPEAALILDPVGMNTRATAANAATYMRLHNLKTVVACSTDYHLYRCVLSFRQQEINAYAVPSPRTSWLCADPRDALREMIGIIVYTFNPNYRPAVAQEIHVTTPRVLVKKSAGVLELYDGTGTTPVKTYTCITGGASGDKQTEGDRRTPLGNFHIVFKNPVSKYHLSLGLDYPNAEDAKRGLDAKLISQKEYDDILAALNSDLTQDANQKKLWYTKLGGEIFLHGHGEGRTGTAGCVALSNPDIEELYALLPLGTAVEIRP